ncbi:MAG: ferredoxin [candidate division Zixibacteria bacterium]|nr:ferredoxin [candidate division Zixibacteria bacterium]MDD5425391.1 ferredoxin [candidate division Zixibacteria bacterium]
MKVKIDKDLCTGDAICVDLCPDVFEMDGDQAKVIVDEVPEEFEDCVRDAAESCPEGCIEIIE